MRGLSTVSASLLALFAILPSSDALSLQLKGRSTHPLFQRGAVGRRRIHSRQTQVVGDFGSTSVGNSADLIYTSNITVGGIVHEVVIDTGSSDLWVSGRAEGSVSTGISSGIRYAKGEIRGPITRASVTFAGYTVPDQAYINATSKRDVGNVNGILGLGPLVSSRVQDAMKTLGADNQGLPFLDRVFLSNTSTPNFLSFTLSREEDPTQAIAAELTIGQLIEGLENITTTPKNAVQIVPMDGAGQHWSLLVDAIIGPDGQEIPLSTGVPGKTKPTAVLDSGFSLPQVPKEVTDAFYGRIPQAYFEAEAQLWVIPCDHEVNVTFVIGGVRYPIHPLDASLSFDDPNGGPPVCVGAYQPSTLTFGHDVFDMILGDGFLRSVYTLIDFGDFLAANDPTKGDPYIQLLSLVNAEESHSDFVHARLGGVDTTSDAKYALLPASQGQTSPSRVGATSSASRMTFQETKQKLNDAKNRVKRILIIVGSIVGGIVVIGLLICLLACCGFCACLGGVCNRRRGPSGFGFKGQETRQVYQPLHAPAPISHPQEYGYQGKGTYK